MIVMFLIVSAWDTSISLISRTAEAANSNGLVLVPAHTAYFEPNYSPKGVKIEVDKGISQWSNSEDHVVWYGYLAVSGNLTLSVSLTLPAKKTSTLCMTLGKQYHDATVDEIEIGTSHDATVKGAGDTPVTVMFRNFHVKDPGMYRFVLTGLLKSGAVFGDIKNLILSGPASIGAHFSADKSRVAPADHLWYQTPPNSKIIWFYNEVTPLAEADCSFYMVCGFSCGYFGIQVNSPTRRSILFSVWNANDEKIDPKKVPEGDKVSLVAKGDDMKASEFGHEGTGGHCSFNYMFKTGVTYRLLIAAQPDGITTIYSAYFYFPEKKAWGMIAAFKRPKDGGYLRDLYSFNEGYIQANGFEKRYAKYGNQWILTDDGKWTEITKVRFTRNHKPEDRADVGGGVMDGDFFLTTGGFIPFQNIKSNDIFTRPAKGKIPVDVLPILPKPKNN
jgi:hypothetical protein